MYICKVINNEKTEIMKTTRINTGIYKIENQGVTFKCEKTFDGQWQMLIWEDGVVGYWEYCEHYLTLSDCKYVIENHLNEFIN